MSFLGHAMDTPCMPFLGHARQIDGAGGGHVAHFRCACLRMSGSDTMLCSQLAAVHNQCDDTFELGACTAYGIALECNSVVQLAFQVANESVVQSAILLHQVCSISGIGDASLTCPDVFRLSSAPNNKSNVISRPAESACSERLTGRPGADCCRLDR